MSIAGVRTVSREDYANYIASDAWREVKRRYLRSKLPKLCYVCETANGPFDLHHRTYKNLGNERLMDLVLVCRDCHDAIHEIQRTNGWSLWRATKLARRKHGR